MFKFVLLKPSLLQLIVMIAKKDKIDPWRLAMLGIGSVRPKSGSVRPDN
jgi:hypothetical protein